MQLSQERVTVIDLMNFCSTLAPDEIQKACKFKDKEGRQCKPDWRDAPNGKSYFPSYNIAPGAYT